MITNSYELVLALTNAAIMIRFNLFLLFCLLHTGLPAQSIRFDHLNVEHGLSQNTVNCILKDSRGYLWIGTNDGLNRYDGYQFAVFRNNRQDTASLSDNKVYAILEDRQGRLWVGTKNGLNLYDRRRNEFQRFRNQEEEVLRGNFIRSLMQDRTGTIWLGTIDGDLKRLDPGQEHFVSVSLHNEFVSRDQIRDIASIIEDQQGQLWFVSTAHGLFRYDRVSKQTVFLPFPGKTEPPMPKKLYEDSQGQIWVATQGNGVYRLDRTRERIDRLSVSTGAMHNDVAKDVIEDEKGRIWIATDGGGIAIYDPQRQSFNHLSYVVHQPYSLGSNAVYSFYKDQEGILWVGTFDAGISIYNKNQKAFHLVGVHPHDGKGLSHRSVLCFLEDSRQTIWIGTDGGGLNRFDRETQRFTYYRQEEGNGLSSDVITALREDRQGRIWIGTYQGGLQCMENGRITAAYRYDGEDTTGLRNNNVWSILEDRAGRLWIGTLGGLDRLDPVTGRIEHYWTANSPRAMHLERVTELYEDRQGAIWVGGKGLRYIDPETGKLQKLGGPAGAALETYDIRAFYEDGAGRFWVATEGGGLFLLDRKSRLVESFTVADGLPSNAIHTLLEDDSGYLWMSTNQGISRFLPSALLSKDRETGMPVFRNYCKKDGLQSNQFSYSAGIRTDDGALYFGGINGFNYFFPAEIQDNPYRPTVEITGLKIYDRYVDVHSENSPLDRSISELESLTLPFGQSKLFSLEFTALNFTSSEKNRYAYTLEGFMDDWSHIGNQRSVTFTNLNPGSYRFRVKASNNDGIWNEEGASLQLNILPPWWKTNWAYAGYILLFALILLAFRYTLLSRERMKNDLKIKDLQREKAEEVNRMKLAFFTNISHELRTPLTLIAAPVERMLSASDLKQETRHQLEMVRRNTSRLLMLINQLLEFRKIEDNKIQLNVKNGDLVRFVEEVKEIFSELAASKDIELDFRSDFAVLPTQFDRDKLEKILYNLLSNAFKFTSGRVVIRLRRPAGPEAEILSSPCFCIDVEDNGPGIPADQQVLIFDRFYQIGKYRQGKDNLASTGAGIGLAYAKAMTELHGGAILLKSAPGQGACFTVVLPRRPAAPDPSEPEMENGLVSASPLPLISGMEERSPARENRLATLMAIAQSKEKPLLLIVEDHADVREFIRDSFEQQFRVMEAADGMEGEELALRHIPDIIISDIMMPKRDGISLCQQLKADDRTRHVPVLLLTANTSEERWIEGLETGADDYVTKPFKFRILEARVHNLIRSRALLKKHFSRNMMHPGPLNIESADQVFLQKAVTVIEENLSESTFGVNEFAQELGMSRSVLYRKFSALTDLSVKEFINMIRLKRAAQLLVSEAGLSVAEVAYSVGFSDSQYFSKKFKKFFHCTPTQYVEKEKTSTS
jgi:ligand-binding sensor domain-containing protein/signal transduction histidine kinase/DNA-binding response OmpR family regulator